MPLELQSTVLNQAPFWDDYDEADNYHRVLFRPGVAVQARELTQLQTILQNQIERFGENIFKTGTVIKGCTQSFDSNYQYVKLLDNQVDGQPCNMSLYANTLVVGTANLRAYVVNTVTGLQTQDPDLNTLYLKYLNTGTGGEKVFAESTVLTCYHRNRRVESINVELGGTGYSNNDAVIFTSAESGGEGAVGTVVTYANGTIKEVLLNEKGTGYIDVPTVEIDEASNGSGASLTASIAIAQLSVANTFYTEPVGTGYAVNVSDGIIFQKGHFVRFDGNTAIVSKYSTAPNNAIVGFATNETIANTTGDPSLLDNAAGALNYKAPGAHRLKLTPTLVVKTKAEAASNTSFFSIVEFENGKKVRQSETTEYNVLGTQLARRTYEESGNYVVTRFPITTESITSNTTHINAAVGAGIAYVEGHRVENLDNYRVAMRKATDTTTDYGQSVSTNYGNYVLVKEMAGSFNGSVGAAVSLRSAAGTNLTSNAGGTPTAPGSQIGTARVRAVAYDSGDIGTPTCTYRLYLFDVRMSAGKSFKDVRAVSVGSTACADIILSGGSAILNESDYNSLVFTTGTKAISSLNNENFIYRAQVTSTGLFNTSGVATITLADAEEFPYTPGTALNNTQERDFLIIPTNSTYGGLRTGNVETFGNTTVQANTGSTTAFLTEYAAGESIRIGSTNYLITRVINDTRLEVASAVTTGTSQAHRIAFPAYVPITTSSRAGAGVTIDSTGQVATLNLGSVGTLNASMNAVVHFNAKVVGANMVGAAQITKSITKDVYVKISGSALGPSPEGPWSLGHADVHKITAVYKGSGSTYNTSGTDVTSSFVLDDGQTDDVYGLSALKKKVGATVQLASTDNLLVKMEVMTRNAGYYMSAESYPVDDATNPLPSNKIRTEEIKLFTSGTSGKTVDLRDCIDFRPAMANTANLATTIAGATIDPSSTGTLSGSVIYFPAPNGTLTVDITSYMPRIDRITLDSKGQIRVTEGTPSNSPTAPVQAAGVMTLGLVNIPPYPTLPIPAARAANRNDLAVNVSITQQRRYTMKDIQDIETRIARLEYYSLLNTLEQNTKNLVIPSELDSTIDRFKNGFFVDPFDNYDVANANDPEYRMFIDVYNSEARPVINQYNVELEYKDALNDASSTMRGDSAILAYEEVDFIEQPHATKYRNCVENSYNYKGQLFTFPAYDNHYDTTVTPQTVDIDIAGALTPIVNSFNASLEALGGKVTITNTTTNESLTGVRNEAVAGGTNVISSFDQTIVSTGTLTKARSDVMYGESSSTVGNYVTNFALQPYIRPQVIKVVAVGLRPGAQHYIFFDKTNVTSMCQPAVVPTTTNFTEDTIYPTGEVGDAIVANERGVVSFLFYVPSNTFMVGERAITTLDVSDLDSQTAAASRAEGSFNAYNFTVDKQALSFNTKTVNAVKTTVDVTDYVSTTRGTVNRTSFVATPPSDPIAQTFRVQTPEPGTDGVVITSLDIFFQRKDTVQGVVVEIREVLLGTPTTNVVPNGRTRLPAELILTSPDASQATTFEFESPVFLKADAEYAFVVYPEGGSPEYLLWTGESGGVDVTDTNLVKKSDWGFGAMFLSTNGTAWTSYQYEDVKFKLKRAKFTSTEATVTLTPKGYEFLTISGQSGSFAPGEVVAQKATTYGPGVVYANTSTNVLSGSGTLYATNLAVGNRILIVYGTEKTSAKSGTVSGNTTSGVLTGSSTDFLNDYATGDYIQLGNYVREVLSIANTTQMTVDGALGETVSGAAHYGVTPRFVVAKVLSITSGTSITIDTVPPVSSVSGSNIVANYQKVVSGVVESYNGTSSRLTIKSSTAANSNFLFAAGGTIVGNKSQAVADITTVDNVGISYIEPHVQTFIPPATSTSFTTSVTRTSNNQIVTQSGEYGLSNRVPFPATIKSRSNEISGTSIVNSFVYDQTISTIVPNLSPIVDTNPGSVLIIENVIDNYVDVVQSANTFSNTTLQTNTSVLAVGMSVSGLGVGDGTVITSIDGDEVQLSVAASHDITSKSYVFTSNDHKLYGISKNRYISKRLALADGLDAEDIKVLITAYKPEGTDVEVYAKVLNGTDGESFNDKDWSKLVLSAANDVKSDSLNLRDYREYEYTFDTAPPGVLITGTVATDTSNTTIAGFGTEFDTELVAGDFVRLVRASDETLYDVRRIASITDFNTAVLDNAPSFTGDGVKCYKITQPKTAFKYKGNDGIVRYYNQSGAYFDTYKYMALKVVLRATNSAVVPTVQDLRALAVSI